MDVPDLAKAKKYLEEICSLEKLREVKKPDKTITWYPGVELWQVQDDDQPGIVKHIAWWASHQWQPTQPDAFI